MFRPKKSVGILSLSHTLPTLCPQKCPKKHPDLVEAITQRVLGGVETLLCSGQILSNGRKITCGGGPFQSNTSKGLGAATSQNRNQTSASSRLCQLNSNTFTKNLFLHKFLPTYHTKGVKTKKNYGISTGLPTLRGRSLLVKSMRPFKAFTAWSVSLVILALDSFNVWWLHRLRLSSFVCHVVKNSMVKPMSRLCEKVTESLPPQGLLFDDEADEPTSFT